MPRRERTAGRVVADDPRHRLDGRRVDIDEDDGDGLRSKVGTTASTGGRDMTKRPSVRCDWASVPR